MACLAGTASAGRSPPSGSSPPSPSPSPSPPRGSFSETCRAFADRFVPSGLSLVSKKVYMLIITIMERFALLSEDLTRLAGGSFFETRGVFADRFLPSDLSAPPLVSKGEIYAHNHNHKAIIVLISDSHFYLKTLVALKPAALLSHQQVPSRLLLLLRLLR